MKTSEKILQYIEKREQVSGKELADFLDITDRAVRKQLRNLTAHGQLAKVGSPPRVFYYIPEKKSLSVEINIANNAKHVIDENFLYISPRGKKTEGVAGFVLWCEKRGFSPVKKSGEYVKVCQKYKKLRKNGVISGKNKMVETFGDQLCVKNVFYADFYAWEIFGKTKLGQLLLYAKQSQDKKMIKEVARKVKPVIQKLLRAKKINAVGFIPPTVKRETQFMKVLQQSLDIALPTIKIVKARTEIVTPQKTLNKLEDRIENADYTILVTEKKKYKNVLLIDDAVGSGATLNQVACKIKRLRVARNIYGFALTGSAKGFDIISEV